MITFAPERVATGQPGFPDFTDALEFERVTHAIDVSAREGRHVSLNEDPQ